MFTRGLNKFYCGSLCDTFKIISPTKTRYQTGEKVAQIQGQDDKFSAKSCQRSRVSGEFILIETKPTKRCLVWKKSLPISIVLHPYQAPRRDKQ